MEVTKKKNPITSKVKPIPDITTNINTNTNIKDIYNYWNLLKLKKNKTETDSKIKSIKTALKKHTYKEIMIGIKHYSTVMNEENYFDKYMWSMENFLKREKGIEYFLDDGEKWLNYIIWRNQQVKKNPDEISKKKKEAVDRGQKIRDIEFKKRAEKVEKFRSETGGSLNLTKGINEKIEAKENNTNEIIKTEKT